MGFGFGGSGRQGPFVGVYGLTRSIGDQIDIPQIIEGFRSLGLQLGPTKNILLGLGEIPHAFFRQPERLEDVWILGAALLQSHKLSM
jgi:hypothetical protein